MNLHDAKHDRIFLLTEYSAKFYNNEVTRATPWAAGCDLRFVPKEGEGSQVELTPRGRLVLPTGLRLVMDPHSEAQIRSRSGLAAKHGVVVLNSPGTIDADYFGELKVCLINHGDSVYTVNAGDRIAQLVFNPEIHQSTSSLVFPNESLPSPSDMAKFQNERFVMEASSSRGDGGFGSTGVS